VSTEMCNTTLMRPSSPAQLTPGGQSTSPSTKRNIVVAFRLAPGRRTEAPDGDGLEISQIDRPAFDFADRAI
jgi:hypothetical protein